MFGPDGKFTHWYPGASEEKIAKIQKSIAEKRIEKMNYSELQAEGRRRQAECGGCNRRPDFD